MLQAAAASSARASTSGDPAISEGGDGGDRSAQNTVRAAIRGWGPTLRLLTIMMAATICLVLVQLIN